VVLCQTRLKLSCEVVDCKNLPLVLHQELPQLASKLENRALHNRQRFLNLVQGVRDQVAGAVLNLKPTFESGSS
jgi:hypothetical protein